MKTVTPEALEQNVRRVNACMDALESIPSPISLKLLIVATCLELNNLYLLLSEIRVNEKKCFTGDYVDLLLKLNNNRIRNFPRDFSHHASWFCVNANIPDTYQSKLLEEHQKHQVEEKNERGLLMSGIETKREGGSRPQRIINVDLKVLDHFLQQDLCGWDDVLDKMCFDCAEISKKMEQDFKHISVRAIANGMELLMTRYEKNEEWRKIKETFDHDREQELSFDLDNKGTAELSYLKRKLNELKGSKSFMSPFMKLLIRYRDSSGKIAYEALANEMHQDWGDYITLYPLGIHSSCLQDYFLMNYIMDETKRVNEEISKAEKEASEINKAVHKIVYVSGNYNDIHDNDTINF